MVEEKKTHEINCNIRPSKVQMKQHDRNVTFEIFEERDVLILFMIWDNNFGSGMKDILEYCEDWDIN